MSLEGLIARFAGGWRGPAIAALIAFIAGAPGVFAAPPLDRDESRFAQATAQMLETGDFVVIRYQDQPRFKKPVGIHWLQAASVEALSSPEARAIWAYRIPSLLGAMLAAAACAWGAAAFFGGPTGLVAGGLLGSSLLLSTEALIAKTDAALCGFTTLAMAALARFYAAGREAQPGRWTWFAFWFGLAAATLIKGPVGPLVVGLAFATLAICDRRLGWAAALRPYWGLLLVAAVVGPWAFAVTVATDGAFWSAAIVGDLAPKLAGGQETHGAPPGYHTLLAPLLTFPMTLLLPAAAVGAWRGRAEPGVRFALCWLVPGFLVFELTPTKLVHYPLPVYGAVAWLAAAALFAPIGRVARRGGAVLAGLVGVALAAAVASLATTYGDPTDAPAAIIAAGLLAAAGLVGAYMLWRGAALGATTWATGLTVLGHAVLIAGLAPRLEPLWLSQRTEAVMARAKLLPRQGLADAPVAVAGYAEPSLVFALGSDTQLDDADEAAAAIADRRPAVVEARQAAAFKAALARRGVTAVEVGRVAGVDYSNGDDMRLSIYRAAP
ncbi:ArnT family glycosyltransferase [Phenylobacterium immobile]|uniref:ArnT family glycosyltransferase n=1 Tax=Phenylobacterium immobile TaxID=21 RepID=UPI000A93515A|nr:glycosyltransferase family 39 protein [Phenylobacterium immobile]